jgi:hypothetical protein
VVFGLLKQNPPQLSFVKEGAFLIKWCAFKFPFFKGRFRGILAHEDYLIVFYEQFLNFENQILPSPPLQRRGRS